MSRKDQVTIVSGLPRSGTSMMMMILEAGGIPVLADGIRTADEDNPKGYYEFERVKKIKEDTAWLPDAKGKVVKMISQLLLDLPEGYQYKILFMRRKMEEILASQKQMLVRRGTFKEDGTPDADMGRMLSLHVDQVLKKINGMSNAELIEFDYNAILTDAGAHIPKINSFLGGNLDTTAMAAVVDQSLYRQRK
ncbi:MAG: sulfotransferase family protein [Phycisphaerae bacterium]